MTVADLLRELGVVDSTNVTKPLRYRVEMNELMRGRVGIYAVWLDYEDISGYVGAYHDRETAEQIGELRYRVTLQHYVLVQLLALLDSKPANT